MKNFPSYTNFIKYNVSYEEYKLNERMGIPDEIKPYADLITNLLLQKITSAVENNKNSFDLLNKKFENIQILTNKELSSIITDKFPLNNIELHIDINPSMNTHGMPFYIEGTSGEITKTSTGYSAMITINLIIHILLIFSDDLEGKLLKKLYDDVYSTLFHELHHEYEEYKRKTSKSKFDTSLYAMQDKVYDFVSMSILKSNPDMPTPIAKLLSLIYVSASYEINARVSQVYSYIKDIENPREREKILKETIPWAESNMLLNFDAKQTYKELLDMAGGTKEEKENIISQYIHDLGYSYIEGNDMLIKLIGTEINTDIADQQTLRNIMQSHKKDIFKVANKKPLDFLKYWEKRFKIIGEKLQKKILKLTTY